MVRGILLLHGGFGKRMCLAEMRKPAGARSLTTHAPAGTDTLGVERAAGR